MNATSKSFSPGNWLLAAAVLAGVGIFVQRCWADKQPVVGTTVSAMVKTVDAAKMTIVVLVSGGNKEPAVEKTFELAKDVAVMLPSPSKDLSSAGKIADVAAEARVSLTVGADNKTVLRIAIEAPSASGSV